MESSEKTFATPQEAFEAWNLALKQKDMRTACQCLTDDSRDYVAANVAVSEFKKKTEGKADTEEKKAQIRAVAEVFTKHGLTDEHLQKVAGDGRPLQDESMPLEARLRYFQEVLGPVSDRGAFVAD